MDERTKGELEAITSLLEHPGWAVLMRGWQDQLDAFRNSSPFNMANEADLFRCQGAMGMLTKIMATGDELEAVRASFEQAPEKD